ncbi:CDGSH iron-sulfur domain-containing protein 3, mitochondrial-like isoform X2 [Stegodyphus dumicola]|uniref:CDGSH iron-sulfur domain-containing protein 3, mitochondrial-like isoform X2 n=1 Tax=Stegodyphus dumicola TaxID=202533 RepID=UPI0015AC28C0|nr:CDGSH iron-sulfur domain-containing protein 3, mitochondrial-like isoform X2 [Stegodyphus dumicola]
MQDSVETIYFSIMLMMLSLLVISRSVGSRLNFNQVVQHIHNVQFSSAAPHEVIVKGAIAKRIPKFVNLEKDKTYSWCACGLSKKQPFCDGSHKNDPKELKPVRFNPPKSGRFLLCRCKQTNNRPYCDLTHIKTFIPEGVRKALNIKL